MIIHEQLHFTPHVHDSQGLLVSAASLFSHFWLLMYLSFSSFPETITPRRCRRTAMAVAHFSLLSLLTSHMKFSSFPNSAACCFDHHVVLWCWARRQTKQQGCRGYGDYQGDSQANTEAKNFRGLEGTPRVQIGKYRQANSLFSDVISWELIIKIFSWALLNWKISYPEHPYFKFLLQYPGKAGHIVSPTYMLCSCGARNYLCELKTSQSHAGSQQWQQTSDSLRTVRAIRLSTQIRSTLHPY